MKFLKKFLKDSARFWGFFSYSERFKRHFDTANSRAAVPASIIVMILEIFMIGYVFFNLVTGSRVFPEGWILRHLPSYFLLLGFSVAVLVFSRSYLKGKKTSRAVGHVIYFCFSVLCLVFGCYISLLDWRNGNQILAFATMEVFVMGFFVWRPVISLAFTGISFTAFGIIANFLRPVGFNFVLNFTTFFIAVFASALLRYHHRLIEAKREEKLDDIAGYLENVAVTDDVTGIPNRLSFRAKVEEIRTNDNADYHKRIFLYTNLQNFGNYNEKYGYNKGTELLRKIANMVVYAFSSDPVARISDDHFVVFTYRDGLEKKLESLHTKIASLDDEAGSNRIKIGFKVGAYIPSPDEECSSNIACDYARYACDSIKKHYDKFYVEYTKETADRLKRRQYILNNIDNAVANGWIKVYYQPVILSENKKLCGFEALARWIDPVYGFLSPLDFITVLEENRQIHKLDAYVLKKVCDGILDAPGKNVPVLPISVNFSRLDFELMDIESLLKECVEDQGIDKSLVHIEVTESALSLNDKNLQTILKHLREKNYSLWLDDFGSGYSSLNSLKEYEFDMMKIDMKFVRDFGASEKSRPILKNIVALAKDIGMSTLSEGVETEDAYEFLKSIGCERIQGYLFGKPMPAEEIVEKIRNGEYEI